jgi:transcriptional regulator with XRE-family HTH domain
MSPPPFAAIANRLEKIQALLGFETRRAFCKHFNLEETRASNWFSGRVRISLDPALRICEEAGVTLDYLYNGNTAGLPMERVRELNKIAA